MREGNYVLPQRITGMDLSVFASVSLCSVFLTLSFFISVDCGLSLCSWPFFFLFSSFSYFTSSSLLLPCHFDIALLKYRLSICLSTSFFSFLFFLFLYNASCSSFFFLSAFLFIPFCLLFLPFHIALLKCRLSVYIFRSFFSFLFLLFLCNASSSSFFSVFIFTPFCLFLFPFNIALLMCRLSICIFRSLFFFFFSFLVLCNASSSFFSFLYFYLRHFAAALHFLFLFLDLYSWHLFFLFRKCHSLFSLCNSNPSQKNK